MRLLIVCLLSAFSIAPTCFAQDVEPAVIGTDTEVRAYYIATCRAKCPSQPFWTSYSGVGADCDLAHANARSKAEANHLCNGGIPEFIKGNCQQIPMPMPLARRSEIAQPTPAPGPWQVYVFYRCCDGSIVGRGFGSGCCYCDALQDAKRTAFIDANIDCKGHFCWWTEVKQRPCCCCR